MLMRLGMHNVTPGQQEPIPEILCPVWRRSGHSAEASRPLIEEEQYEARDLGQRVAEVTAWFLWDRNK
jgi:hypothetical protein